ncbi:hypothetical protein HHK36_015770 [Tetracentron sinense]|uniref:DUF7950 domain-containing protein n=1 Tax=Tetracentron sinense TaxID=13715 RepID=A0A834Z5T5_TETSI|nr:hypothetical protein HHK36_015770 [Tetracentron sinense]
MGGRGGCCIARYGGGAYDMSKIHRIMLRYRPIAPKPAVGGCVSGESTPKNVGYVRTGRAKRRYVRDGNNKRCNRKRKASREEKNDVLNDTVVTLPLLPETPDRKESPARRVSVSPSDHDLKARTTPVKYPPMWLNFSNPMNNRTSDLTVEVPQEVRAVGSCVVVECVTDTCIDGEGLGSTDEEKRKSLEGDTCPGFVSDGRNGVQWTNEAYRKMVGQGEGAGEMMVWLVMKERLPAAMCPVFACRVRLLQYSSGKERNSLTVPCDVWRMEGGGFAWRLDVKAALSLGR